MPALPAAKGTCGHENYIVPVTTIEAQKRDVKHYIASRRAGVQASPPPEPKNPFLVTLGERVRALRARRGMTRKAVALAADVSERHLANLEYGIGNAVILVLLQVAGALRCPLAELLGDVTTSAPSGCCCANCWNTATKPRCAACAWPWARCWAPAAATGRAAHAWR
jgi:transcriptional regulator with XRE-family HTH domain